MLHSKFQPLLWSGILQLYCHNIRINYLMEGVQNTPCSVFINLSLIFDSVPKWTPDVCLMLHTSLG